VLLGASHELLLLDVLTLLLLTTAQLVPPFLPLSLLLLLSP
jgi:hypothetical protein